jgi:hypothetical protein
MESKARALPWTRQEEGPLDPHSRCAATLAQREWGPGGFPPGGVEGRSPRLAVHLRRPCLFEGPA